MQDLTSIASRVMSQSSMSSPKVIFTHPAVYSTVVTPISWTSPVTVSPLSGDSISLDETQSQSSEHNFSIPQNTNANAFNYKLVSNNFSGESREAHSFISNSRSPINESRRKSGKSTYKHIPHREKPPHLVAKRNARERRRVQAVNSAFARLRKCVPVENRNKRLSKVKTLQKAIEYIAQLQEILNDSDAPSTTLTTAYSHVNTPSISDDHNIAVVNCAQNDNISVINIGTTSNVDSVGDMILNYTQAPSFSNESTTINERNTNKENMVDGRCIKSGHTIDYETFAPIYYHQYCSDMNCIPYHHTLG